MAKLLIVSFDAVGSVLLERLCERETFRAFYEGAGVVKDVRSMFLTNTYPVHASVATGVPSCDHGIISNTEAFPKRYAKWCYEAKGFRARTLWQAAKAKGLKTAAVLWPVTAGAKEIRYNIPEILTLPGESQIAMNLKYGSPLLSIRMFLKYRHLMQGLSQPQLDDFITACATDILKRKKPDLVLVHLTAFDTICHHHGTEAKELDIAMDSLCAHLEEMRQAAGEEYKVIVFSDHYQIDAPNVALPNDILFDMQLLKKDAAGDYQPGKKRCFIECCGGSAFFHPGECDGETIKKVEKALLDSPEANRLLTEAEMAECGRSHLPFGIAAKPGWFYNAIKVTHELANHGYPPDYDNYSVFYMLSGAAEKKTGGTLLDVTALAAKMLDLDMPKVKGKARF